MRKRWVVAVLGLAILSCLALPSSALAKAKLSTFFVLSSQEPTIPAGGTEATVSGHLYYRKAVVKNRQRSWVTAAFKGKVYLAHYSATLRNYKVVATAVTSASGYFSMEATAPGYYDIRYHGSSKADPCADWFIVEQGGLHIGDLTVSATPGPAGTALVTASADVTAPAGVLTTATPGFVGFSAMTGSPVYILGSSVTGAAGTGSGTFRAICDQTLFTNGTYTMGFIVPSSSFDDTMTLSAFAEAYYTLWYSSASTTTSFTVSGLLGP